MLSVSGTMDESIKNYKNNYQCTRGNNEGEIGLAPYNAGDEGERQKSMRKLLMAYYQSSYGPKRNNNV
jgi:hypothetical protein